MHGAWSAPRVGAGRVNDGSTATPRLTGVEADGGAAAVVGPARQLSPVAFSFGQRRVRLLDLDGIDLREHAFLTAVRKLAEAHPERQAVELDWSDYVAAARQHPILPPAGFLFNVARCGSTLLANMLDAVPGTLTLKESGTIAALLHHLLRTTSADAECQEVRALLAVTISELGRLAVPPGRSGAARDRAGSDGVDRRVFVKPHSWATLMAGSLMTLFPTTPALFLYRDPFEVVASMLAKSPYGNLRDHPTDAVASLFPSLAGSPADLPPASFYAHLWRSPVEAALALPPDRLMLVDYAELARRPRVSIERLAQYFRLDLSTEASARLIAVMDVYAKDVTGAARFDAQGAHRRPPLTTEQHTDVQIVVGDLYAQLTARRQTQT